MMSIKSIDNENCKLEIRTGIFFEEMVHYINLLFGESKKQEGSASVMVYLGGVTSCLMLLFSRFCKGTKLITSLHATVAV